MQIYLAHDLDSKIKIRLNAMQFGSEKTRLARRWKLSAAAGVQKMPAAVAEAPMSMSDPAPIFLLDSKYDITYTVSQY